MPARTAAPLCLMLRHPQPDLGQIEHLPTLNPLHQGTSQIIAAVITTLRRVTQNLIRAGDHLEMPALVTGLPAGLAA